MERILETGHFNMWLAGIALAGVGLLFVRFFLSGHREHQDEPVYVRSRMLPVLGHTVGMMRGSNHYIEKLASVPTSPFRYRRTTTNGADDRVSLETPQPIFKIQVLRRDLYVVNCPEVASAIYRNSKSLSFSVMIMGQMRRLLNLSSGVVQRTNPSGDPSLPELRANSRNSHSKLRPNKDPAMFAVGQEHIRGILDGIPSEGMVVDLLPWLHGVMSKAGAAALYGRDNPVAWDPSFLQTIQ